MAVEPWIPHVPQVPRVPRLYRAPIVYGSPLEILATLGWALVGLVVVALVWTPIILAAAWAYRRLHH